MKCCATVPILAKPYQADGTCRRRLCQREASAGSIWCWQHEQERCLDCRPGKFSCRTHNVTQQMKAEPREAAASGKAIRPFRCLEWGLTDESRRQILREMGC